MYIALTTLQIRRLLWDDVESANVCIVRCSSTHVLHLLMCSCCRTVQFMVFFRVPSAIITRCTTCMQNEAAKKEMDVQLRKSKAWFGKSRDPQGFLWTWAICSLQSWRKVFSHAFRVVRSDSTCILYCRDTLALPRYQATASQGPAWPALVT